MTDLAQPHHDGSPLYLDDEAPTLGATVRVRCRTAGDVDAVWIRTTEDAEPTFHSCSKVEGLADNIRNPRSTGDSSTWWEGELPVRNPVAHYRFLIVSGETQTWLTGAGVWEYDVPDAFDFRLSTYAPAPDWARDGVVYQIFPDRFARSGGADDRATPAWATPAEWDDPVVFDGADPLTPTQLYGGDLDGVTDHLDHLAAVGADIVYTTPVFPGESNHRYNASTFEAVDPLLGGDEAYARLAGAVHQRGWRILGDLTTNHTGDTHEWFTRAVANSDAPERDYYFFHDDGSYESWMGHHTLPKVNHADPGLRAAFVDGPDSIVGRWLRPPYSLDGWRIDVANMTGRLGAVDVNHDVARAVRRTAESLCPDAWVIGEHNHDASTDVDGDGWHGVMNYSGFSWPVWEWLRSPDSPARSFGTPVPVARRTGPQVVATMRLWMGRLGFRALASSWNILGSHDSARIRTMVGSAAAHHVAAGLQFTLPGVPMIFAGDELGLEGIIGEDSRRPMPWADADSWDRSTLDVYSALAAARRESVALRRGGLRWVHVSDDVLVYMREHPEGSVLVCARRAASPDLALPLAVGDGRTLFSTHDLPPLAADAVLPASTGPAFAVWAV
ncbi:glycoside hydrolase family 13 protein [Nocardioides speluncae]|uniref:glycoside hydrolase family 13 protein n=1 Tax=Nocardioides speluncae TaxID=2670337 RepID=UPI000D690176|nr:glycoside hydrolase family 13 protein [Nocardioides speluncae]